MNPWKIPMDLPMPSRCPSSANRAFVVGWESALNVPMARLIPSTWLKLMAAGNNMYKKGTTVPPQRTNRLWETLSAIFPNGRS